MADITPVVTALVSFLVTALLGFKVIPYLHKLKFGQTILDIGPSWHKNKQGTPTMGGIMLMAAVIVSLIIGIVYSVIIKGALIKEFADSKRAAMLIAGVVMALAMGFIGFLDDYIKVVKKRNLGLTAKQKTFLQSFVTVAYLVSLAFAGMNSTWIPFVGNISITHDVGLIFWPIAFFFIYGFVNAVNLTDGLDGLASSVTLVVSCAFMIIAGVAGSLTGMNCFASAVAGTCGGFLVWNMHPAKVFMGDTGSMFLGGAVVAMSFGTERPVLLILIGIVYLLEALSVVLQVTSYKLTKKRIFKMSPIHHHFEMSGWSEEKIVFVFSAVGFMGGLIAILTVVL
ncbi:MAG: phospho-N-acetylmuramoyl-pentapeptide-transferase [Acutalibacteraceae bacterium]|nr:phospho-N-acetylmuramoyl-pentapeptide-transferase [Acutalibacteraceae bacterium]